MYSLSEWIGCYSYPSVFATAILFLSTWLFLWKIPDTVLVCNATINLKHNYRYAPLSLSAYIRFHLPLRAGRGIIGEVNKWQSSWAPFFRDAAGTLWVSHLVIACIGIARGAYGAMPPPKFLAYMVILCFERWHLKQKCYSPKIKHFCHPQI